MEPSVTVVLPKSVLARAHAPHYSATAESRSSPANESQETSQATMPKAKIKSSVGALAGRLGSWHLPSGQTFTGFCAQLNREGIRYTVMPSGGAQLKSGQVAVLVSDRDTRRVRPLITRTPLGQQLAVYSPTGLPGFSFQQHWRYNSDATNMAVLPAHLAEALLEGAQVDQEGCRRPKPEDELLWEIYRALYLAGDDYFAGEFEDGSATLIGPAAQRISDLARTTAAKISGSATLGELERYLADHGWEPPYDVLRRISSWNSWARSRVREIDAADGFEEPGMAVFFIRREVLTSGMKPDILGALEGSGFELLSTIDLTDEQVASATRGFRGGNWGPGSFKTTGGPPVELIIALDVFPYPVSKTVRQLYPHLDNGRILEAKRTCRQLIEDRLPADRRFNPLHSTDTGSEAWSVIRQFAPDLEQETRVIMEARKAAVVTEFEVVRSLTRKGARAKIELIRYGDGLAVKKTFRHNSLRFLEREIAFMEALSPKRPEILPVIDRGPNYFISPFIEGKPLRQVIMGRGFPKLMTLRQTRELADLMRYLFSHGYDPVDLAPYNLLVDRTGHLTAIDFEFVHQAGQPVLPEKSACLAGVNENFAGEWPPGALYRPTQSHLNPYGERWFGHTALTLHSFLYDAPARQWASRLVNYPIYLGGKVVSRLQDSSRAAGKRVLKDRLPVLTRIASNALRSGGKRSKARR
jgi:hypothetical protein